MDTFITLYSSVLPVTLWVSKLFCQGTPLSTPCPYPPSPKLLAFYLYLNISLFTKSEQNPLSLFSIHARSCIYISPLPVCVRVRACVCVCVVTESLLIMIGNKQSNVRDGRAHLAGESDLGWSTT